MIQIPFTPENFSNEAKNRLSGINVSLEYDNIESGLFKTATILCDETLGEKTYNTILSAYDNSEADEDIKPALDYLQRGMLNLTVFDDLIFLIVKIGNDGITVKKSNEETTLFKYQQDELSNKLINNAWVWLGKLIQYLNDHLETFPGWKESSQKKELDQLPIGVKDFSRWVGLSNVYFVIRSRWLIQEVWMDKVEAHYKEMPEDISSEMSDKISRAVVYSVMELATIRLPYADLPENIRKDIDNEMSKTNKEKQESHIRESVSKQFAEKALRYWADIEMELAKDNAPESVNKFYDGPEICENDKFYSL